MIAARKLARRRLYYITGTIAFGFAIGELICAPSARSALAITAGAIDILGVGAFVVWMAFFGGRVARIVEKHGLDSDARIG